MPYQRRWIEDPAPVKVCVKSRRVGITWAEAADAVLTAAAAAGDNVFYISYNNDQAREFVETCATWAKILNQACSELEQEIVTDEDEQITAHRIRFPSGRRIVGLPSRPRTVRGKQGVIVIDEAAIVDEIRIGALGEMLTAAMAMLIWDSRVRVISTYKGRYAADGVSDQPFWRLVEDVRSRRLDYSLHEFPFRLAVREGLYRVVLAQRGARAGDPQRWSAAAEEQWLDAIYRRYGEGAAEELDCIPSQSGRRYLKRELVERAMRRDIPVLRYTCPPDFAFAPPAVRRARTERWIEEELAPVLDAAARQPGRQRWYVGWDVARNGDLSCQAIFRETQQLGMDAICYVELRQAPFDVQAQVFYATGDRPEFARASIDSRGNGQQLAEEAAQRYGPAYVDQCMLTRAIYAEEWPVYRSLLEDELLALPQDADLLTDHQAVQLDRGVPIIRETTGRGTAAQRHGDGAVAGLLANRARRTDDGTYQPYRYEPVPLHGAADDYDAEDEDEEKPMKGWAQRWV